MHVLLEELVESLVHEVNSSHDLADAISCRLLHLRLHAYQRLLNLVEDLVVAFDDILAHLMLLLQLNGLLHNVQLDQLELLNEQNHGYGGACHRCKEEYRPLVNLLFQEPHEDDGRDEHYD